MFNKNIKLKYVNLTDFIMDNDIEDGKNVCSSCPFNLMSDESAYVQNMGCLPDHNDIIERYLNNEGHWKCHSCDKPCSGLKEALKHLKIKAENNSLLVTEDNPILKGRNNV